MADNVLTSDGRLRQGDKTNSGMAPAIPSPVEPNTCAVPGSNQINSDFLLSGISTLQYSLGIKSKEYISLNG